MNQSRFEIMMSKFSTRVASRRFNSVERNRDYFSVLSETNRKFQISIRLSRVEQITQKWRSFVAHFSSVLRQKKSLSNKRRNEIICYNCDKQNHVRSECLISLYKINFRYAKKKSKSVNIVFVLQARIEKDDVVNHIFIDVWIDVDSHKHSLRIMINFNAIENFVNQFKIKKLSFQNELSWKEKLKILDETSLRVTWCDYL